MKLTPFVSVLAVLLLAACSQAPNSDAAATKDTATPADMAMSAPEPAQMADQAKPATADTAQAAKTASATGTVESVDAAASTITIAHGPIEALQWPAMTMGFKATPEQVASVQVGQKVQFEFESKGMDSTITQIAPVK